MTLQLALNEAAKKQGYKNWNEVENKPAYGGSSIRAVACIAAELYAEADDGQRKLVATGDTILMVA